MLGWVEFGIRTFQWYENSNDPDKAVFAFRKILDLLVTLRNNPSLCLQTV